MQRGGVVQSRSVQWIPAVVIVLAVVVDLLTPHVVTSAPLLIAAPVFAGPLLRPRGIILTGLVSMGVHVILTQVDGTFAWGRGTANLLTLLAVTVLALFINRRLDRQYAHTARARQVAAVAQRAVLPDPPARIGTLQVAARYVPAEDEALIGGDLYVVQDTPHGIRALIGDVRGKGLGAVSAVCSDLGAFRYAADEAEDLAALARAMERALTREGDRRGGLERAEGFTTGLLAEFAADLSSVRLVNRGHPPPVLLDAQGTARLLEPSEEAPPLGIGALQDWPAPIDTFDFPPGATLILYTDGVSESRDTTGTFYDATLRLPVLARRRIALGDPVAPGQILDALIRDVRRHTGDRPLDDQALLALHRPPEATFRW